MPARLSSMELSPSSNPGINPSAQSSRRKSGRVTRAPEKLSTRQASSKRKRKDAGDDDEEKSQDDVDMEDASEDDEDTNDDGPDEEELRESRRRIKASKGKSMPNTKKARHGQASAGLAIRSSGPSKASNPKKARAGKANDSSREDGLFGSVFSGEDTLDGIAADWLQRFDAHESSAVAEVVNFTLRCSGCDLEVTTDDIEDPDNCASKLTDMQDEFQAKKLAEYPLIAKGKATPRFRRTMTSFINALVQSITAKGLLLEEPALIENIQTWVCTMSDAANRPFRHTATVFSLEVISALCRLARGFADDRAKTIRQSEGEQKNKKTNRARISDLKTASEKAAEKVTQISGIIRDWFDTVFVHRYRDVDPKIRVDCVAYLSEWIWTYPEDFLDGSHLRYLGWVLSDTSHQTRHEVVKQLQRIFKDETKIGGLRQFTERFRPRIVEMAARDGDVNVRCSAIDLLDILRDKGLLEPDDIDTIGKLLLDAEPRVRKSVVPFFVASVDDLYQSKIEDLEDEALQEYVANEDDLPVELPRSDWLRFKALAELLHSYDSEESEKVWDLEGGLVGDFGPVLHSRMSLAAEAISPNMPVLKSWEVLAGFLLTDHSAGPPEGSEEIEVQLREASKLDDKEEILLLDVLHVSVKNALSEVVEEGGAKKPKKTKAQLQELQELQESAAQRLALLIPKLLTKFGAAAEAASAVLRLEHVLNLDVFQELRQDSTTYAALLEDINKQFLTHDNPGVLSEAKAALLHALSFEQLEEVTEPRLEALWQDTTLTLTRLCKGEDLSVRGNMHVTVLNALSSSTLRLESLASISDCTLPLESPQSASSAGVVRKKAPRLMPIACLIDMLGRGVPTDHNESDVNAAEDALVGHTMKTLLFYFMWRITAVRSSPSSTSAESLTTLAERRDGVLTQLRAITSSRSGADAVRIAAAGMLLELTMLFSTLRHMPLSAKEALVDLDLNAIRRLSAESQHSVLRVFSAAERDYARKANKTLVSASAETQADAAAENDASDEEEAEAERERLEAEPESSDDEADGEGEADDDEDTDTQQRMTARRQKKQRAALLAEQQLCTLAGKLVLAIVGGVVDASVVKPRLYRNRAKLGPNFKEVVAVLDEKGDSRKTKKQTRAQAQTGAKPKAKSKEVVDEDEEDEDDPIEEDDEDDLRRRGLLVEEEDEEGDQGDEANGGGTEVDSVIGD